jgi:hypothetical protein
MKQENEGRVRREGTGVRKEDGLGRESGEERGS